MTELNRVLQQTYKEWYNDGLIVGMRQGNTGSILIKSLIIMRIAYLSQGFNCTSYTTEQKNYRKTSLEQNFVMI